MFNQSRKLDLHVILNGKKQTLFIKESSIPGFHFVHYNIGSFALIQYEKPRGHIPHTIVSNGTEKK